MDGPPHCAQSRDYGGSPVNVTVTGNVPTVDHQQTTSTKPCTTDMLKSIIHNQPPVNGEFHNYSMIQNNSVQW